RRTAGPGAGAGARPSLRRFLRRRPGGRVPADPRRQRVPPGGVRRLRRQRAPGTPAVGRARLPPSSDVAAQPRGRDVRACDPDPLRRQARVWRRVCAPWPRHAPGGGWEIVLCGGAINSPQLLQLSGVGSVTALRPLGIEVVQDLPGVGENLQDHLEVYVQHSAGQPVSVAPHFAKRNRPRVGLEWLLRKSGPGATNHFEAGGFVRSNDQVTYPNLMFHFLPIAIRYDGTLPPGGGGHGYQVHVGPMYSDVRGTCKVVSNDPRMHPALRFNYLSTENDRREWLEAGFITASVPSPPAPAAPRPDELSPGPGIETDEQILDWVATDAETALHPSCTCRMGTDDLAVTDPLSMRVHGTDGLRVVDASVFPYIPNGNIYAPVMMSAEKAADIILGNTPLEPQAIEFSRHEGAAATASPRPA